MVGKAEGDFGFGGHNKFFPSTFKPFKSSQMFKALSYFFAPSSVEPCRNGKIHECHSEPKAKNLAFAATCEDKILRLRLRMTIAT
jgi:hypothetical protein